MMMQERRILLVEDNPDDERLTLRALRENQVLNEVVVARDGAEALDYLFGSGAHADRAPDTMPDVVLLDLKLPKVDGLEAMGRMLSQDRSLPIILHSAYTMYKDDFQTWSADAYVVKSSDLTELMQKIDKLLEKRQAESEDPAVP